MFSLGKQLDRVRCRIGFNMCCNLYCLLRMTNLLVDLFAGA